jgi:chromosome segregation ATPase
LAWIAHQIIKKEQDHTGEPRQAIMSFANRFLAFCLFLALLTGGVQLVEKWFASRLSEMNGLQDLVKKQIETIATRDNVINSLQGEKEKHDRLVRQLEQQLAEGRTQIASFTSASPNIQNFERLYKEEQAAKGEIKISLDKIAAERDTLAKNKADSAVLIASLNAKLVENENHRVALERLRESDRVNLERLRAQETGALRNALEDLQKKYKADPKASVR